MTNADRLAAFRYWLDTSYVLKPSPKERHFAIVSDILGQYPTPTQEDLADYLSRYSDPKQKKIVRAAWLDFWECRADVCDRFPEMP
jgi:hypothetical protein